VIKTGPWKGYIGIVKEITETTARIELHTKCKVINVARDNIQMPNIPQNNEFASGSRDYPSTPAHWTRTPMREDAPATPMRTPQRSFPGTPSHDPWNPAVPNTPRAEHGRGWGDDDNQGPWTPGSSRDSYSMNTPGYPGSYPFSPAPASDRSHNVFNPSTPTGYTSLSTPTGFYSEQGTPQESTPYSASTPGTPSTPGLPQTPSTPGTPGGDVGTPADEGSQMDSDRPWQVTGIEVVVSHSFRSGAFANAKAVIQEVHGDGACKLQMTGGRNDTVNNVPGDMLEPLPPAKKDQLKVIRGEFRGHTGSLIGVYGLDGIVKLDSNSDIKILPMTSLAKVPS